MITFKTQFPLNPKKEPAYLFEVGRTWLAKSPYSSLANDMEIADVIQDGWSTFSDSEKIIFSQCESTGVHVGLRHERNDDNNVRWTTEVVFTKKEQEFYCAIQLSVESELPAERINFGKRPHIVKTIIHEVGGGIDGHFSVDDKPTFLSIQDLSLAAEAINAKAGCSMPVVYVSANKYDKPHINPARLSQQLSGMAHVLVEPSRDFSYLLMDLVEGGNAYGGAVGIYWPDGVGRTLLLPKGEFLDKKRMHEEIINRLRISLLSHRTKRDCTWGYIQEQKSKKRILELRDAGSGEIDEYIAAFDIEIRSKEEEIQRLEAEINRLKYGVFNKGINRVTSGNELTLDSQEKDLYQGERLGIIVDALNKAIESSREHSRRYHVLKDLVDSNGEANQREVILDVLKTILKGYKGMGAPLKKQLEELGFTIRSEGKHHKLIFRSDERYSFTIPKSGGDVRGGLNSFFDIKASMF